MKKRRCIVCNLLVSTAYYVFGLNKNNKKHIYGYYCYQHSHKFKDWLDNTQEIEKEINQPKNKVCGLCKKNISSKYYVFGLNKNNKKHIYGYYCRYDAKIMADFFFHHKQYKVN